MKLHHRLPRAAVSALVAACWTLIGPPAASQIASLTRDIVPPGLTNGSSYPSQFVALGSRAVFLAGVPGLGVELWASDGTSLGTELLLDSHSSSTSTSLAPKLVGVSDGLLYFTVFRFVDASTGHLELWSTHGTREGTVRLLDGSDGVTFVGPTFDHLISPAPGGFFFVAATAETSNELWHTDGTPDGTRLVKDIHPTSASQPHDPALLGGKLYFFADDGTNGTSLWVSDGTGAGTALVRSFAGRGQPDGLQAYGNRLAFFLRGSGFDELWTSGGTASSTVALRSFPMSPFPFRNRPSILGASPRRLYFVVDDGHGEQLWRTDGTRNGTAAVTAFEPSDEGDPFRVQDLAVIPGQGSNPVDTLVFIVDFSGLQGVQLWRSQGTPQSNRLVKHLLDYVPAVVGVGDRVLLRDDGPSCVKLRSVEAASSSPLPLLSDCAVGGETRIDFGPEIDGERIVYQDLEDGEGLERRVWRISGASAPARLLATFRGTAAIGGGFSLAAGSITKAGDTYFLNGFDDAHSSEPWVSQGTPATTRLLVDLDAASGGSGPYLLGTAGDRAYFGLAEGPDFEVWRSDGDPETTQPATDLAPRGCFRPTARDARTANGLLFGLTQCSAGHELWRTDGTPGGMVRLTRADGADALELVPGVLAARGDRVLFAVRGEGTALWESDGTPAGTRELVTVDPEATAVRHLTVLEDELYFVATVGIFGEQSAWRSDGTGTGTRRITAPNLFLRFEPTFGQGPQFTRAGNHVYFVAEHSSTGAELWVTDGTPEGTDLLQDLYPGTIGANPVAVTAFQGSVYFIAIEDGHFHRALRRQTGTARSLPLVNLEFGNPDWLEATQSALFFARRTAEHGTELWATDGTPAGTRLVKDIWPGSGSIPIVHARTIGDRLLFAASEGVLGQELWVSDGTATGTHIVHDIAPGPASSSPEQLTVAGSSLYFSADDGLSGRELWRLPLTAAEAGCRPGPRALCLQEGRFRVEAQWRTPQGTSGTGQAMPLTADTGYFWFFDQANVEAVLKVLDGRGLNGHHWVFYGALSDVDYAITVTDAATGATRRYLNPVGQLASVGDTDAFGPRGASTSAYSLPPDSLFRVQEPQLAERSKVEAAGACVPSEARLCVNQGRFAVEASWRTPDGTTGVGHAVALAADTGYFWFFRDTNLEVVLKVLDGRPVNSHFWVFYGALSNVEYTLTVTDTETGAVRTYRNPAGRFSSLADTAAF
ncbi:MAG TPA: hypothetical protein VF017_03685 [Thermoanaerobaculia bacterium]|nr:hypothetical protein [Thermoanaerobaculia bacterium]